jgi:3-hydroxyisobutyrate dehydrogenase-like beta-hydroxyacid dehydrogenase
MEIGFIGLGMMGQAMALNLLRSGHKVTVYNRTRSRAEDLQSEGAIIADHPQQTCAGEIVITMLADDAATEEILFGSGNIISAMHDGAIHISMSTISVALSERLTEAHHSAGQQFVAAPVFGRPQAAAAGQLNIVAAGSAEALERCHPAFDVIGQKTFVVGEKPSIANVIKLSGNFLIVSMTESLGEAFALTRKSGIDPDQYLEIMTSILFPAPIYKSYGGLIAQQKYDPPGFRLKLGLKDIRLVLAAAEAHSVPMPAASVLRDHLISAIARGYEDLDVSALALVCAEDAGL